jgi:hypothetical protein
MPPKAYFKAWRENLRDTHRNDEASRLVGYAPVPGQPDTWYFRTVRRAGVYRGRTDDQFVVMLRGGRAIAFNDTGYGGFTSGPLVFMPKDLFLKITAQIR